MNRSNITVRACKEMNVELESLNADRDIGGGDEKKSYARPLAGRISTSSGAPYPLGPSPAGGGVNFALRTPHAEGVTLWLYFGTGSSADVVQLELSEDQNKTEDVWHICCSNIPMSGVRYAYSCTGPTNWKDGHRYPKDGETQLALDPYAKLIEGRSLFGDKSTGNSEVGPSGFLGTFDFESEEFNWEGDDLLHLPENDLIIYEMSVRGLSVDTSSILDDNIRGSYVGVIEKIPHLLELGVNAVELLPVYEFDELEFQRHPNPRDHMVNVWGYSTINFFSPMRRYASSLSKSSADAAREFKEMVKALHANGIEVILDVVYNHTAESDDKNPYPLSFRPIDNKAYYLLGNKGDLLNFSGCGNTVKCNGSLGKQLILDSLHHWVTEYHIDGFRFDLATCLCRDESGELLSAPPLIREISKDPILSKCRLISEPWDIGAYQVGSFPNWDIWAEWNGRYRDDVRRFIRGGGRKGKFATRLSGSADMYKVNNRKVFHSINFIIAHDGFTLRDLVTYDSKHNKANGENNRDGTNDNESWNCGCEGETQDWEVIKRRRQQMRNFMLALFCSQGTPMILMGDEYGHTKGGNNNSYGHDAPINNFDWNRLEIERRDFFRFLSNLVQFRKDHPLLGQNNFLSKDDVTWHEDRWNDQSSCFLAFTLHDKGRYGMGDLYLAFNSHGFTIEAPTPKPPKGEDWYRIVDTDLESPRDFNPLGRALPGLKSYKVRPYSSIMMRSRKEPPPKPKDNDVDDVDDRFYKSL